MAPWTAGSADSAFSELIWSGLVSSLSKCLRIIAGAPWHVSSLQLHEDLVVPYLAEHIRKFALSFGSKIPDSEKLLVRHLGRYLAYPRDE